MQRRIATAPTRANRNQVLALLRETPQRLLVWGTRYSLAQLDQSPMPGERSITQTLAHLLHCEARTTEAIVLALCVEQPLLASAHPERDYGKVVRFDQYSYEQLVNYFVFRRQVLLRVLEPLHESQWARTVREPGKQRQESVYWLARALALHEHEHLAAVARQLGDAQ
jgi:hypothetical protein